MSLSKYITIVLYKSAKQKQETCKEKRAELARFKREKRLAARLVRDIQ